MHGPAANVPLAAFVPYGTVHLLALLVSVAAWWTVVAWGRALRGGPLEQRWRRGFALFVWGFNAAWCARLLLPDVFACAHSLPLHLCDLAWMAAGWSLWSGGEAERVRHQAPVLWGLALSFLAYASPAVTADPDGVSFWTFWITHWQVLAVALVNLLVLGTRITWRGLRLTLIVTTVACAVATAVNLLCDTSYFFTGRARPANPSPADWLGEWPLRALWIALLGALALVLVALPLMRRTPRGAPTLRR